MRTYVFSILFCRITMELQGEHAEIIKGLKVMVYNFIEKGIIPCSALDILNNKLQPERLNLFLSFGVDLRVVLSCIPLEPTVQLFKIEKEPDPPMVNHLDDSFFEENDVEIKVEIGEVTDDVNLDEDNTGPQI